MNVWSSIALEQMNGSEWNLTQRYDNSLERHTGYPSSRYYVPQEKKEHYAGEVALNFLRLYAGSTKSTVYFKVNSEMNEIVKRMLRPPKYM